MIRWHDPQRVVYMDPHPEDILGFVPSIYSETTVFQLPRRCSNCKAQLHVFCIPPRFLDMFDTFEFNWSGL